MWLTYFQNRSHVHYFSTIKMKKYKGFTLLELLVVIGIIGVLTALATVAYSTTQQSGRNARRKQDLVAIQNALEQYYSVTNFSYPIGACNVATTYLKSSWPTDPAGTVSAPVAYTGDTACTATAYCICATMEGSKGGNAQATDCAAANWIENGAYYCVGNLQ